ncbi:choice-of-anchor Q domain-containing protein [Pirellulimonas nuda]|uniref:choice-of-anchor Q domain-containing protein n=1 Tax=Pirellulimonas nuda TaxID=2528009 RepID=UPI001E57AEF2|nr:SpaA isopeptide-forming pilin-related protein [Pirellulimonas nuda]
MERPTPRNPRALRFEPLEDRRLLAVFTVMNLLNSGQDSLRDAVLQANASPNAGGVPDRIEFQAGLNGPILLTSRISISGDVVIDGTGHNITIDGQLNTQLLYIESPLLTANIDVTLRALTLQNGKDVLSGPNSTGGAIESGGVDLTIDGVTFAGNQAGFGGAIAAKGNRFVNNTSVRIIDSLFTTNVAQFNGGAIDSNSDAVVQLEILRSRFVNNASGFGGALMHNEVLSIRESEFTGNTAQSDGGAIAFPFVSFLYPQTIANSTFTSNVAGNAGGAISWIADVAGADISLVNNTITNNSAGSGGGLSYQPVSLGAPTLENNIIALNTATGGVSPDLSGAFDPLSTNNLIGVVTGSTGINASINLVGANPDLGLLAFNGGPNQTQTRALLAQSAAIDAGSNASATGLVTDQRGFLRISNGTVDIGAYEVAGTEGAIHGQKWHDVNGDGVRDPTEPGLDGWTIEVIDSVTGAVVASQLTRSMDMDGGGIDPVSEQGLFWISGVPAGTYRVRELAQPGWRATLPTNASGEYTVTVQAGLPLQGVDFGNFLPGSIHGQKWDDLNDNGLKDPNEIGVDGWVITAAEQGGGGLHLAQITREMDLNHDGVIDPSTEKGLYWFGDLPPGTYFVGESSRPGWHQSYPSAPGGHFVAINAGQIEADVNFGNNRDTGSIHGFKFIDFDGDGSYNSDIEVPLPHIKIGLFGDSDGDGVNELTLTHTDENGDFWFTDLVAGQYIVSESPGDYIPTTPTSVSLTVFPDIELVAFAGQAMLRPDQTEQVLGSALMFGNLPPSSIHGFKFTDADRNGVYDPLIDEPWAGVWFGLWGDTDGDGDSELKSAVTDASGNFWFTGLHAGQYTVSEVPPDGSIPTTPSSVTVTVGIGQELVAFAGQAMLLPGQTEVVVGAPLMFGNATNTGSIHGQKLELLTRQWRNAAGTGGLQDNYAAGNTETTNPSAGLLQIASNLGATVAGYDSNSVDRFFIDTFYGLPTGIISATVRIGLRSNGGGSSNDTIGLGVFSSAGVLVDPQAYFSASLNSLPAGPIKTISLPATMLPFLNGGQLDVSVQDDTAVDFVELCVYSESYVPRDGWTIDLLDTAGNVVSTQQTMSMDVDGNGSIDPLTERSLFWFQNLPADVYRVRERAGNPFVWQIVSPSSGEYFVSLRGGEVINGRDFVNENQLVWWTSCWAVDLPDPELSFGNLVDGFTSGFIADGPLTGVLTFDGLSGVIPADQYLLSDGVLFDNLGDSFGAVPEGGVNAENIDGYDGSYNTDGDTVYGKYPNHLEPFTIVFTQPVSKVGSFIFTGREGPIDVLSISLYDTAGNLLDTREVQVLPFADSDNREGFWGVEATGDVIARVTIRNNNPIDFGNTLGIDNIYFARLQDPSARPGDYNGDGAVDAADYTVWRDTLGLGGPPPFSGADGDGDGEVTQADYNVWRSHFGEALPQGAGSVSSTGSALGQQSTLGSGAAVLDSVEPAFEIGRATDRALAESRPTAVESKNGILRAADLALLDSRFTRHDSFSRPRARVNPFRFADPVHDSLLLLLANDRVGHSTRQGWSSTSDREGGDDRVDGSDGQSLTDEPLALALAEWR